MLAAALALLAALARHPGAPAEGSAPGTPASIAPEDPEEPEDLEHPEDREDTDATLLDPEAEDDDDPGDLALHDEPDWVLHPVAPGETIERLALRYRVDPGKIRAWNGLASKRQPRAGQTLRILARRAPPPRERVVHTVHDGDTWTSIARLHGAEAADLRRLNRGRVGPRLRPGDRVEVWSDPTLRAAVAAELAAEPAPAVRPGGISVGRPHDGRLLNGVRVPEAPGHALLYPGSAWGSTHAVRALLATLDAFRARSAYQRPLVLATMSRQRGRRIAGHRSHQSGRDLDVRLLLRDDLPDHLDPIPRRVDWAAVWELLLAFEATGATARVFLDYGVQRRLYRAAVAAGADRAELRRLLQFPRGPRARRGLVRHSPGHDRHLHVRFRCAPYELECAG